MKLSHLALSTLISIAASTLLSAQAFAGAFSINCSDAGGMLSISKFSARVGNAEVYSSASESPELEYESKSVSEIFGSEPAEHQDTALTIEVVGKKTMLSVEKPTDDCGNHGEFKTFAARVIVKQKKSGKTLLKTSVICTDGGYPGHCA